MSDGGELRVVVADDDLLVRHGVKAVLDVIDRTTVVAEAGSLDELLAAVASHQPDVVVTDIRMPPTLTDEGIQATRAIRRDHPDCGVVVLSQHAEPEFVAAVFEAGNDGVAYLLKENVGDIAVLTQAVTAVADGGSAVDPAVVAALVAARSGPSSNGSDSPAANAVDQLTPRETDVLSLIAEGLNNGAIAERLVLSDRAVAKHINSIFSKLNLGEEPEAHRRVRAVLIWLAAAT